jgi:hypothetical protein
MIGRSGCLLLSVFLLCGEFLTFGQDARLPSIAPRFPVDPPSARLPVRIVLPPRAPITPPGVFGFPAFSRAAGMIFSGTVTKIGRPIGRNRRRDVPHRKRLAWGYGGAESRYQSVDWLMVFRAALCHRRARSLISISEEQVGTDQLCGRSARAF